MGLWEELLDWCNDVAASAFVFKLFNVDMLNCFKYQTTTYRSEISGYCFLYFEIHLYQTIFNCVQHGCVYAEWPCNQGWEVTEANEGKEEQSEENPWS